MHACRKRGRDRALGALGASALLAASAAATAEAGAAGDGGSAGEASALSPPPSADAALVSEVLPSGLRVFVEADPDRREVAARAAWTGGLRLETPTTAGMHDLLARVVTSGCGDRGAGEVARIAADIDASIAGVSGRDGFGIAGTWPAASWERGFELFADCVRAPRFERATTHRERRRSLEAIRARGGDPGYQAFRLLSETLYRLHPYGLDPGGTPESVDRLSRRALAAHYRRAYPVAEMTLAIVGDVDPDEVLADVRTHLGGAAPQKRVAGSPPEVEARVGAPGAEVYRYVDAGRAIVAVGFPGVSLADPDRYPLEVLATILGAPGGRLADSVGEKLDAAYDLGALSVEAVDPGYVAMYVACAPDRRDAAMRAREGALDGVRSDPVHDDELEAALDVLVRTHEAARTRPASRAAAIALHEAHGLGYERHDDYVARIEAVTADDVARVAASYLDPERAIWATVMPKELTPAAARWLRGADEAP